MYYLNGAYTVLSVSFMYNAFKLSELNLYKIKGIELY